MAGLYSTPRWRRLRATIREDTRRRNLPCSFCGRSINVDLPHTDDWSFQVDHIRPAATHPELFFRRDNLAPAHKKCNISRTAIPAPQHTVWIKPKW